MAPSVPTIPEIQSKTSELLGVRPCYWQAQIAQALLRGDKDILSIAGTGSGKTLTFWIPLLFRPDGIQIVATPLNILGKQNEAQLAKVGIRAIALRGDNSTHDNWKAIEDGVHRAVIISPEEMFKKGGGFSGLAKKDEFTARIIGVIWDEGHCLGASSWGTFRSVYKDAGRLRHILPKHIPYYVTSATLDDKSIAEVMSTLQIRSEKLLEFHRSNDRPNIHISVRKITRSLKSFHDLDFLIPKVGKTCPKALVFFDTIAESIAAAKALKARLPPGFRVGIKWFNSDMSAQYRDSTQSEYKEGGLWALFCTDSFGMGVDLPDIDLVVQWRVTCDMRTLWQRFGRAARDPARVGQVLLLAEGKWFDDERAKKKAAQEKRAATNAATAAKRKAKKQPTAGAARAAKRLAVTQQGTEDGTEATSGLSVVAVSRVAEGTTVGQGDSESEEDEGEGEDDIDGNVGRTVVPTTDASLTTGPSRETARQEQFDRLREIYVESREGEERATRTQRKGSKKPQDLSPELDNLVNAKSRPHHCYRVPILAFFASDKIAPDQKLCRPDLPGGCQRCCVTTPIICCELCNPAAFASFAELPELAVADRTSLPGRSRKIVVKYPPMEKENNLRLALHDFRRQRTIQQLSKAALQDMGPGAFMSNAVLQRIVDCARVHKIHTVEQLERETQWKRSMADHDEVLRLVTLYFPPVDLLSTAPLVRVPLAPRADQGICEGDDTTSRNGDANPAAPATTATRPPKKYKCSKCRVEGHIASNRYLCPWHPKYQPRAIQITRGDENLPPVEATRPEIRPASPEPAALVNELPTLLSTDVVQLALLDLARGSGAHASTPASDDESATVGLSNIARPRPRPRMVTRTATPPPLPLAPPPLLSAPLPLPPARPPLPPTSRAWYEEWAAEPDSSSSAQACSVRASTASYDEHTAGAGLSKAVRADIITPPTPLPSTSRASYEERAAHDPSDQAPGSSARPSMQSSDDEPATSTAPCPTTRAATPPLVSPTRAWNDERTVAHGLSDLARGSSASSSMQPSDSEPTFARPLMSARPRPRMVVRMATRQPVSPTRASYDERTALPNLPDPLRTNTASALTQTPYDKPAAAGTSEASRSCVTRPPIPPPFPPMHTSYDEAAAAGPSSAARGEAVPASTTILPALYGYHSPFGPGTSFAYHAYSTVHHTSLTSSFPHLLYEGRPSARFVRSRSPRHGSTVPTSRFYGTLPRREQDTRQEPDNSREDDVI